MVMDHIGLAKASYKHSYSDSTVQFEGIKSPSQVCLQLQSYRVAATVQLKR